MTITQDLRTRAKHRGKTRWELIKLIGRLEREADEHTCQLVAMATQVDELTAERGRMTAQFEEAAVAHQAELKDLTAERDHLAGEVAYLREKFAPELAAEANANKVTVPPMVRDTSDPADQATGPIDVTTLWAARDAGLLGIGPVLDPGRIR